MEQNGSQAKTSDGVSSKMDYPLTTTTKKSFGEVDHIVNADQQYLFCKYWKPEGDVTALVFHAHGYGEHCRRSQELAEKLCEMGVYSFAHDHIGHGDSQGLRGHVLDYTVLVRDILQHVDIMKEKYPDVPIFLYGHSMGGALVIFTAQERPSLFKGVLLSAPYIAPSPDTATPFKVFLAKMIVHILPKIRIGKLNDDFLSRDADQIKMYVEDPLVDTEGMRASMGVQCLLMADRLKEQMKEIEWPFFLAHSEVDKLCDVGGSKLLFEVCKSKDKTFKLYEDAFHMLEHELPEFVDSYFTEVTTWLKARI